MADDLDAELAALEDAAPLTDEPIEGEVVEAPEGDEAKPADEQQAQQDDWTPPNRETYENVQKALRAEREAKRQEARRAAAYEQNIARMEQGFQQWQQQMLAQQLQQAPPDPYADPDGAKLWQQQRQQQLQALFQAEQQRQQQINQAQQQERQFAQLSSTVDDYEAEFTAAHPDYHEATDHMLAVQQQLLTEAGWPVEAAKEQVSLWSQAVARQAIQAGKDPAKWAYENAQRMGYVPAAKRAGSGVSGSDKIANIQAGQKAAQTLSGGGTAPRSGGPSLKEIAGLEGAAFDKAFDKFLRDASR